MTRSGRRPGQTRTRQLILGAARAKFAAEGYAGATIRGIAAAAEVDPALVHHYFGTKRDLFVEALEFPFDPAVIVATVTEGDREYVGERLVRTFLMIWTRPETRPRLLALARSATTDDEAARMMREFMTEQVLLPVAEAVNTRDATLGASLAASQMVGLAMLRYIIGAEPLASAESEVLIAAVAPTIQRYLTGDLGRPGPPG